MTSHLDPSLECRLGLRRHLAGNVTRVMKCADLI